MGPVGFEASSPVGMPSPVERLGTGDEPRAPRTWLRLALVLVVVAGLAVWWVADRRQHAEAARQIDAPVLARLEQLKAHGNPAGSEWLTVFVDYPQSAEPAPFDVVALSLDAGALGQVRAVVLNEYQGTGEGPLLTEVKPFRASRLGVRADLAFEHAAVCGAPVAGDPPLVMTVRLPSGRTRILRLRIDDVWNQRLGGSTSDAHRPWPVVLSELACDGITFRAGP
jgi:hypothetical protein